ncbi:MAG: hypothetical protein WKF52_04860 [Sphingomicrobium sp.]
MILLLSLLPALISVTAVDSAASPRVRTTFVQNEFVTRVPVRPRPTPPRFGWVELQGPNCIALQNIRGALLSGTEHVDFVMADNRRVRARFDGHCPALDFYEGFYLNSPNRLICAGRDAIRSRMGGTCSIGSFRRLAPVRRAAIP